MPSLCTQKWASGQEIMPVGQRASLCEHGKDQAGRVIREDVSQAAKAIWKNACTATRSVLGDDVEAAEILERCAGRVSRYLDTRALAMFTQNVNALLFVSFRRELWSVKRRRRIAVDINECADYLNDSSWAETVELQLDLENLVRQLSSRGRVVLTLRRAGYAWKEVAALLRTTVPEIKKSFWREVVHLRSRLVSRAEKRRCNGAVKPLPNDAAIPNGQGRPVMIHAA